MVTSKKNTTPIPKIITDNPFRIIGVYANSSQKEIVANQSKATAFLKVGKQVEYPLDLTKFLPAPNRTVDSFSNANSQLTIAKERLKYAQFWFLKSTPLDEIAFNHLIAGDAAKAVEIWDKKNCASSLQNKIVCHFINKDFEAAINEAEDLYEQFSGEFLKAADNTGTLQMTADELRQSFIDTLCAECDPQRIYNAAFSDEWKSALSDKIIKPIIDRINAAIKEARDVDGDDSDANLQAARKLWKATQDDFAQLKKILPANDMQLESIADKLGLQILQCGINYYNNSDDDDAAETAWKIQEPASKIVIGEMAKDRCEDNLKVLKKIIDELPPKEIRKEHNAVMAEIEKILKKSPSISAAETLLKNCKPYLQTIKGKLGATHTHYLKVSTIVVSVAMRILVGEVNEAQETAHDDLQCCGYYERNLIIEKLKTVVRDAWDVTLQMDEFDIEANFKSHYNTNRSALKSMCEDLRIPTTKPVSIPIRTTQTTSSGTTTKKAAVYTTSSSSSSSSSTTSSRTSSTSSPAKSDDDSNLGCIIVAIIILITIIIGLASK